MPKTKFQTLIFTAIVAALMTYFMAVYNIAINSPTGFTNQAFIIALREFIFEFVIVLFCAFFVAGPIAKKLAFRIVNPESDRPIFVIFAIQIFTVCVMVGMMSFYALFAQKIFDENFFCTWRALVCQNFLMALPLQLFLVGPLSRKIFRSLFRTT